MPDFLLFALLVWVVLRWTGCGFARHLPRRWQSGREWHHEPTLRGRSGWPPSAGLDNPARSANAAVLSPEPLDVLKRRYVDGAITVEQYEAELDRLFARQSRTYQA